MPAHPGRTGTVTVSTGHPGLCVITTREKVTDISHKTGYTVKEILLEQLSDEAGLQLLKNLGIKGSKKEILAAVQEYKGHALALTLLGNYIAVVHEGDIRKRDLIPALTEEEEKGCHARRVIESYERWLEGSPELDILYMMGLFDRPIPVGAAVALKEGPVIEGVTTNLQNLSHAQWQYALERLRKLELLARHDRVESKNAVLDCHPLIREYFGQKLREQNPEGWKAGHKRLYYYYKELPEKEYPDTLNEMEPLFAAVAHGCQAGLHQEAEEKQKERQPQFHFLYGLAGYLFCDLLLGKGNYREVMERAGQTTEISNDSESLLEIALYELSLGRAWLMQALEKKENKKDGTSDFKKAYYYLDQSVAGLWKSGYQYYIPLGLLARAAYYRIREEFSRSWNDLNEALEITELGSMRLYLADYHLEAGRLCLAEKKKTEAKKHFNTAKEMIDKMGYHRGDKEVSAWNAGMVK